MRPIFPALLVSLCWFSLDPVDESRAAETNAAEAKAAAHAATESRLRDAVEYLASDELEGRGVGTEGLDKAADFLAEKFAAYGLKTNLYDGTPFQKFTINTATEMGPTTKNRLALLGPAAEGTASPPRLELELFKQFTPLALGGSSEFELPLVFVGYGITAKDLEYDEYDGLEVKDKLVVVVRKEPQQANPHSKFNGTEPSMHALFSRKVSNAFEHGAKGVIFINDLHGLEQKRRSHEKRIEEVEKKIAELRAAFAAQREPSEEDRAKHAEEVKKLEAQRDRLRSELEAGFDTLIAFAEAGADGRRNFPVFFATREAMAPVLEPALGMTLEAWEKAVDEDLNPRAKELTAWRASGQTNVVRKSAEVKNVIAVLEGEGPLAEETVILGAHYDHLGRGGPGSLAPWTNEIHNGADDNASGTAVLLEVARRLAEHPEKLPRRVVFIAFTAEERGLIGSARYTREPLFPLESTVAMLNLDMVGRLNNNELIVQGHDTADSFEALLDDLNLRYEFKLAKRTGGRGPSDHASFYPFNIPVMHFFTGTHSDYHRPSDDSDRLNIEGMRRIADMFHETALEIARAESRPKFQESKQPAVAARGGSRPYFGSIPDFAKEVEGYAIQAPVPGSPAEQAGIQKGDVLIRFGESKIGNLEDFDNALRKYKAGDEVPFAVRRDGKEVELKIVLGEPR